MKRKSYEKVFEKIYKKYNFKFFFNGKEVNKLGYESNSVGFTYYIHDKVIVFRYKKDIEEMVSFIIQGIGYFKLYDKASSSTIESNFKEYETMILVKEVFTLLGLEHNKKELERSKIFYENSCRFYKREVRLVRHDLIQDLAEEIKDLFEEILKELKEENKRNRLKYLLE